MSYDAIETFRTDYKQLGKKQPLVKQYFSATNRALGRGLLAEAKPGIQWEEAYNPRNGISGVVGAHGEMIALVVLAKKYPDLEYITSQFDQKRGWDFKVKINDVVKTVSVKNARFVDITGELRINKFIVKTFDWQRADLIVLADVVSGRFLMADYEKLINVIKSYGKDSDWNADYTAIPKQYVLALNPWLEAI